MCWDWLQDEGWVDDFSSISGVLSQKGIPNPGNSDGSDIKGLKAFFALFEGDNAIPRQHLPRFTSMHFGKGSQGLAAAAKAFWDWLKDTKWVDNFSSISGVLSTKGIPNPRNPDDPDIKGLKAFFALFEGITLFPGNIWPALPRCTVVRAVKGWPSAAKLFWDWLQADRVGR